MSLGSNFARSTTTPADEGVSNISRMRQALGLLDMRIIKKSITEHIVKEKEEISTPCSKKEIRNKNAMISSAKLLNNENYSPLNLRSKQPSQFNQPSSGTCLNRN